ncbi:MAG: DUF3842 family protein [Clostridia bacterium]|nr:DUF3842 family protein [Clostridia bacterium]
MRIAVLDGQGGGIGKALIGAILPILPEGAELVCVGTNAMATAAMLKAGAQRGATGENSVRWAAEYADVIVAPIALVLKNAMMGEVTEAMAACVGASRAKKIFVPTQRCNAYVAGVSDAPMQTLIADAARLAVKAAEGQS